MTTRTRPKKRAAFVSRCDVQSLLLVSLPPLPSTSSTKSIYEWYNCLRPEKLGSVFLMLSCDVQRTKFFSNKVFRLQREYPPFLQRDFSSLALIYGTSLDTRCAFNATFNESDELSCHLPGRRAWILVGYQQRLLSYKLHFCMRGAEELLFYFVIGLKLFQRTTNWVYFIGSCF